MSDELALAYALRGAKEVIILERELMDCGIQRPMYIAERLKREGIPAYCDKTFSVRVRSGRLDVSRIRQYHKGTRSISLDQVYTWIF